MADLVEVRVNGKTIRDAVAENRTQQLDRVANALVVATRMAKTIRQRAQRGDFATKPKPYRTGGRYDPRTGQMSPYYISEGYQEKLGAPFRRFQSSAHFHRVVGRRVAGNVTGGLWAGLRVRNFGISGAVIEFTGRSLGMRIKKRSRGKPNQRVKVGNRLKAATVFRSLGVNIIQPQDKEIEALGTAAAFVVAESVSFGDRPTLDASGDRTLARALVDDIRTGRVTRYL
jgi:hypothetical protein